MPIINAFPEAVGFTIPTGYENAIFMISTTPPLANTNTSKYGLLSMYAKSETLLYATVSSGSTNLFCTNIPKFYTFSKIDADITAVINNTASTSIPNFTFEPNILYSIYISRSYSYISPKYYPYCILSIYSDGNLYFRRAFTGATSYSLSSRALSLPMAVTIARSV